MSAAISDQALAARIARRSGSSFYYAFLFMPRGRREAIETLYAFCREVDDSVDAAADRRIDELFERAKTDRSKAFELKQELDRLGRFKEFEDRFLDLFRKSK